MGHAACFVVVPQTKIEVARSFHRAIDRSAVQVDGDDIDLNGVLGYPRTRRLGGERLSA